MARMETVVKQIKPSLENALISQMAKFGWEVYSTQEVANNYQEMRGEDLYNVNEKYVKITFQRDKDRAGYQELCELERQYNAVADKAGSPSYPAPAKKGTVALVLSIIGFALAGLCAMLAFGGEEPSMDGFAMCVLFGIFAIIMLIVKIAKSSKGKKRDEANLAYYRKECEEAEKAKEKLKIIEDKLRKLNY